MSNKPSVSVHLSIRLDLPNGTRFGPGKAALLLALATHGSISGAARALGMSYPKALRLVEEVNTQFSSPVVKSFQGGAKRGGAHLTELGQDVCALYKQLTETASYANTDTLERFCNL